VLMRFLRWYLLRVFESYCLEKKFGLQRSCQDIMLASDLLYKQGLY